MKTVLQMVGRDAGRFIELPPAVATSCVACGTAYNPEDVEANLPKTTPNYHALVNEARRLQGLDPYPDPASAAQVAQEDITADDWPYSLWRDLPEPTQEQIDASEDIVFISKRDEDGAVITRLAHKFPETTLVAGLIAEFSSEITILDGEDGPLGEMDLEVENASCTLRPFSYVDRAGDGYVLCKIIDVQDPITGLDEDWRSMHHMKLIGVAKRISFEEAIDKAKAIEIIAAYLGEDVDNAINSGDKGVEEDIGAQENDGDDQVRAESGDADQSGRLSDTEKAEAEKRTQENLEAFVQDDF